MSKDADPFEVLRQAAQIVEPGYPNSPEMFNEFKAVFLGTPQGQRVFHQIMTWAGFFRTSIVKGDPYATHVREGERNIGARIWAAVIHEPVERPQATTRRMRTSNRDTGV